MQWSAVLLFLFATVQHGRSLDCYQCDTNDYTKECGDPFVAELATNLTFSCEMPYVQGTQDRTQNGAQDKTQDGAQKGAQKWALIGTKNEAQDGAHGAQIGAQDGAQAGTGSGNQGNPQQGMISGICYKAVAKNLHSNEITIFRGCSVHSKEFTCGNMMKELKGQNASVTFCETCTGDRCNIAPRHLVSFVTCLPVLVVLIMCL